MKRKILAILLTICMILPTCTFFTAFATPTDTNVFEGKTISTNIEHFTHSALAQDHYGPGKMVDGISNGSNNNRYSTNASTNDCEIVISLGTTHALSSVKVYENVYAGGYTQTYSVYAGITDSSSGNTNYSFVASGQTISDNITAQILEIPFGKYVNADKVKIVVSRGGSSLAYMIREIEGYGYEGTYVEQVPDTDYDALKLWYTKPAKDDDKGSTASDAYRYDAISKGYTGWENEALPLGNGYMGAMVFGRTDSDRIQLTENSLSNPYPSGLTNFAEVYLDFNHTEANVSNYYRDLNLDEGTQNVKYTYNGVNYERQYITSYPDKIMAVKLTASGNGNLSFTLRPTIPYLQSTVEKFPESSYNRPLKSGKVSASGDTVTMKGVYAEYEVKYEGQFTIVPQGDNYTMTASNDANGDNGTITLTNADSAIIYIAIGTNYPLKDTAVFENSGTNKLVNGLTESQLTAKLKGYIDTAKQNGYDKVLKNHQADYKEYFGRVKLDLDTTVPTIPTDELVANYKKGSYDKYLEILLFQYGRYMLICSSREGTLPPNLQGIWNRYQQGVCMVGYWHNVNVQLTYWPVFVTNLTEMFTSYKDYFDTILPSIKAQSTQMLKNNGLELSSTGDNGWNIGTGASPFHATSGAYAYAGNDGNGCGPFTAEIFWDYYRFTGDINILKDWVYPVVRDCANYSSRVVSDTGDGLYLTRKSASPENHVNGSSNYSPDQGDLYPQGTTYDQSLIYDIMNYALTGAEILHDAGLMTDDEYNNDEALTRCRERIGKLDPIKIGTSGQIKEFREETYYAQYGQASHRHISHLMGIYPGTIINYDTPVWQDAAKTTLPLRESADSDWKWAFPTRAVVWARLGDGNEAHNKVRHMMALPGTSGVRNNLLTGTPSFQIDGNAGSTAAFAEMLIQSHMGYIEPLKALPDAWEKGMYDGLLARDGFEVGATWDNMKASELRIKSQMGKDCVIKYPGIGTAVVKDSDGNTVSYTKNASDKITFATQEGKSYTITQIADVTEVDKVSDLEISNTSINNGKRTTTLSWTPSADATNYNVYYALNDNGAYTLAGNTTSSSYTLPAAFDIKNDRVTYAVTAVAQDGSESDRTWLNENAFNPLTEVTGKMNSSDEFVINISTSYQVDSFKVYKKEINGTKTFVTSSQSNEITLTDATPYINTYIVCAVEGGAEIDEKEVAFLENAALGKGVTVNHNPAFGVLSKEGITDGSYKDATMPSGKVDRYVSSVGVSGPLVVEIDLGAIYKSQKVTLIERWENKFTQYQSGITVETGLTNYDGTTTWKEQKSGIMKTSGSAVAHIPDDIYFDEIATFDKIKVTYNRSVYDATTQFNVSEIMVWGSYEGAQGGNVAQGKNVTVNIPVNNAQLPASSITDGVKVWNGISGTTSSGTPIYARYASKVQSATYNLGDLEVVIDLEDSHKIHHVALVDFYKTAFRNALKGIKIEGKVGTGDYKLIKDNIQLTTDITSDTSDNTTLVDLGGEFIVDKVKVTYDIENPATGVGYNVTEIMVYGEKAPTLKNIAKGCLVEASIAPIASSVKEENMTDGINHVGTISSQNRYASPQYAPGTECKITVNLKGTYDISSIILYERKNAIAGSTSTTSSDKTKLEIGTTKDGVTTWQVVKSDFALTSGANQTVCADEIILDKIYTGDKVRITLKHSTNRVNFTLTEIEVYGEKKADILTLDSVKLYVNSVEKNITQATVKEAQGKITVTYSGFDAYENVTAFAIFYDASGNIVSASSGKIVNGELSFNTDFSTKPNISRIKIFTWDTITSLKPLLPDFTKYVTGA